MKKHPTSPKSVQSNRKAKKTFFSLRCEAQEVFLAGSFNQWNPKATPLQRDDTQHWQGEVPLLPGTHEYQFVVDGRWMPDPLAPEAIPNPFGSVNSVVRVAS